MKREDSFFEPVRLREAVSLLKEREAKILSIYRQIDRDEKEKKRGKENIFLKLLRRFFAY